jgi:hypothetical protein
MNRKPSISALEATQSKLQLKKTLRTLSQNSSDSISKCRVNKAMKIKTIEKENIDGNY